MSKLVHVAAAAIEGGDGSLLIARRPDHTHQGGFWEFPGGKVEPGESVEQALCRELEEELAIRPRAYSPLIRIPFEYPDKRVLLDVWRVSRFEGTPRGVEGQPLRWVAVEALAPGDFPPANRPIVAALQLPDHCMITGEFRDEADFLRRLGVALGRGVRMVQFRAPGLDTGSYRRLALEAKARCREAGATLLLNASPEVAASIGGVGLHLNGRRLRACRRADLESLSGSWIGASCHDLEEVRLAQGLGVDFVSLSPVQRTATHPETDALGWERFCEWVDLAPLPVYGLGGLERGDIARLRACGAQGVAAIRAFWPQ